MFNINNIAVNLTNVPPSEWRTKYIGDGYRYCCSRSVGRDKKCEIILFGYDKNNNPCVFRCPHKPHIAYVVSYKTENKDIFGRYIAYRYFESTSHRKNYIDSCNGSLKIVECLRPEAEFLHMMFDDVALNDDFNKQELRIHYIDIETEISEKFEKPKDARNKINLMTIYDTKTEKYYTWSLHHVNLNLDDDKDEKGNILNECPLKDYDKDRFEIFEFYDNEARMLEHFLDWFEDNYPDVLCGFNSQSYDTPYIANRIKNVLGESDMKRLSPVRQVYIRENNLENERSNKQAEILVDIGGIFSADELVLYRDKFKINQPMDGGNSLDNIGEVEVGIHKIHYKGMKAPNGKTVHSLKDLYEYDWDKFVKYNIMDVHVLRMVEEKVKLIPLARSITSIGLSNSDSIYASIGYIIGSLIMFSKTQMNSIFLSYKGEKSSSIPYEGAYVFEPIPGLYKGGICTVDFNSLYPSSIQAMNLSPETYVGKISRFPILDPKTQDFTMEPPICLEYSGLVERNSDEKEMLNRHGYQFDDQKLDKFYLLPANGSAQKVITREQLLKLLDEKCIFTRNNTLFLKHKIKKGVISEWCRHFYALRKSTKKNMQGLEMDIYNKKISENDIPITKETIQNLDTKQQAIKILINSCYGIIGTPFSPCYNVYCAQSITRTGKFCNTSASVFIKNYFKENYNIPDNYIHTVSGDTDSQFVNIKCITDKFIKENNLPKNLFDWKDDDKLKLWKFMDNFVETTLNGFVQDMITKWYHTDNAKVLRYSLEYMADNGIYESKKHYCCHKICSEGPEIVDKIKYSGIELKKASIPKEVKTFLADIYSGVITKNWNEQDFRNYVNDAYDKICKMDIEQLAFWKGYGTEREAEGFLQMKKGVTSISASCTYYNQLLERLGIGSKYDSILIGDKVRFCYIDPNNKYGIKYIAFKDGQYPDEFRKIFKLDYPVMFDKLVLSPLKNFIKACGYSENIDPNNQNIISVDSL